MVETDTGAVNGDFDSLAPDAGEEVRQNLAERLASSLVQHLIDYPWLSDPVRHLSNSAHVTRQTFVDAVVTLYHPAQLDVLRRAGVLAQRRLGRSPGAGNRTDRVRHA
jgi:hypothetical protein